MNSEAKGIGNGMNAECLPKRISVLIDTDELLVEDAGGFKQTWIFMDKNSLIISNKEV